MHVEVCEVTTENPCCPAMHGLTAPADVHITLCPND
ncbi:Hypothetical protein GSB_151542 [Giardia duodenalis]|uniref:Uncharacterized protein n=1 Tax=Giardia intestinalis TaxID=5741 RepID=V6U134_GIAIN|nr:Hypothetical protein GSB_151542 [Giardia intestinalis]